ncbi:MAG: LCP family protein [Erysipelotrichaceae bacterium]|nr:LCP family protein [Erysipelotrichaceae bacterium]
MKKSIFYKVVTTFLSVLLIVCSLSLLWRAYKLEVLPSKLFTMAIVIVSLITLILLVLMLGVTRRWYTRLLSCILVIACCTGMVMGNTYMARTDDFISKVTQNNGSVKNTVNVLALEKSKIQDEKDLSGKKVGVLKSIDQRGTDSCVNALKEKNISITTKKYTSLQNLIDALYQKKVDAIILNETYRKNVVEIDGYEAFDKEVKTVYQSVFYTEDVNEALSVSDVTTKPFTILISGNDSYGDLEDVSRSDVNLLVTINPSTQTVLMTSLPRDYYVPVMCDDGACAQGALDKLTHTGMHGVDTTRDTIENLLGIDINYTVRVNFSSLENIVEAVRGVDVYVEEGLAVEHFYANEYLEGVEEGWNHLNGPRALAFARERHAYEDGDVQRVKNQQQVLNALINKIISSEALLNYNALLDAIAGSFETNMSMEEIKSFIKFQLQTSPSWKFENFVLIGYGDRMMCAELGNAASVLVPDQRYIETASQKIHAVLEGKSSKSIKENFDKTDPRLPDYMEGVESVPEEEEDETTEEQTQAQPEVPQQDPNTGYDPSYYDPNQYVDPNTYVDPNQNIVPDAQIQPVMPETEVVQQSLNTGQGM